jgi:hypothetical protein
MGVRISYSQAYHHAANGRAETQGKVLQQLLRKIHSEDGLSWMEALPRALQHLHDLPGVTGLSPYEVVYGGRQRSVGDIPYQPQHESPDAVEWLRKGRELDKVVSQHLAKEHRTRAAAANKYRKERPKYSPGQKVWVLRPRKLGSDKMQSWWLGPCPVLRREGEDSYVVEIKPGKEFPVHATHLKPHILDQHVGKPVPLFFHRMAKTDLFAEVDEWEVEKIVRHHVDQAGQAWFYTKWKGVVIPTWEPLSAFITRFSPDWAEYCRKSKLNVDVVRQLCEGQGH